MGAVAHALAPPSEPAILAKYLSLQISFHPTGLSLDQLGKVILVSGPWIRLGHLDNPAVLQLRSQDLNHTHKAPFHVGNSLGVWGQVWSSLGPLFYLPHHQGLE